jgi:hypothetical protein
MMTAQAEESLPALGYECPACEGSGKDPEDETKDCRSCDGTGDYSGIANAWGQYGVSSVYVDTDGEDASENPRKLVCMDTFVCETTMTPEGAIDLAGRLYARADEIRDEIRDEQKAGERKDAVLAGEHFLETVQDALEPRAFNCLRRSGIWSIEGVRRMSDAELLAIPNLGKTTLARIREVCA